MSMPRGNGNLPAALINPDEGPNRSAQAMIGLLLLFVVVALIWSAVAELDVAVQARGAVVPPSRLQEVQSLEGGIVQEVLVKPGQSVRKGQVLARLDHAQYTADLGETSQQVLGVRAGQARLEALLGGRAPIFDVALKRAAPDLVAKETQLWRDALSEFRSNSSALRESVARKQGEWNEAQSRALALQASVRVAEESFAIEERLFREGAGSRADYLGAQQRLLAQRLELEGLQQSMPRLKAGLAEALANAAEAESKSRASWGAQLSELHTRAATMGNTLKGREDRLARRELLSPMDGVVNRVLVPTQGGVAAPGKAILEIVPTETALNFSARVRTTDIGFIRAGQTAQIRILTYDASTFGKLTGRVDRVGADAVVDERGESYYEVQLSAARDQLRQHGQALPVLPGMSADIGILTGRRSVLQYLLKPVLRGLQGALQER